MSRLAVAATRYPGETRAVLYDQSDMQAVEVRVFRGTPETAEGAVWRGRVLGAVTGARAVLVDIGGAQPGFLSIKDWPGAAEDLREGRYVTVAIERPPRAEKGPRVTGKLRLSSPWLVFSPFRKGISVSRRIPAPDAERLQAWAKDMAQPGDGWVVRGSAATCDADFLKSDSAKLRGVWSNLQHVPNRVQCLRVAPDPFAEWLAELSEAPADVSVTGAYLISALKGIIEPEMLLVDLKDAFVDAGGEDALADALSPEIALPSGGSLTLEMTRAFWVADVDSNGVSGPNAARLCNDEAVAALTRELRLRNLGGGLVVDLIPEGKGKSAASAAKRVLPGLRAALDADARAQVYGVSPMGHLELVRARRGLSLYEVVHGDTAEAGGAAVETAALAALRQAAGDVKGGDHSAARMKVSASILGWLNGPGRFACAEAEAMIGQSLYKEIEQ